MLTCLSTGTRLIYLSTFCSLGEFDPADIQNGGVPVDPGWREHCPGFLPWQDQELSNNMVHGCLLPTGGPCPTQGRLGGISIPGGDAPIIGGEADNSIISDA